MSMFLGQLLFKANVVRANAVRTNVIKPMLFRTYAINIIFLEQMLVKLISL